MNFVEIFQPFCDTKYFDKYVKEGFVIVLYRFWSNFDQILYRLIYVNKWNFFLDSIL